MPKLLAIDYGRKRIGIAVADTLLRIAMPLTVIQGRNDTTRDARAVADLATSENADELIVGHPINMDGTEGLQSELTRRFADELARLSGLPIRLHDERLSSFAADEALNQSDLTSGKRKSRRDAIAAQKILQAYLDQMADK